MSFTNLGPLSTTLIASLLIALPAIRVFVMQRVQLRRQLGLDPILATLVLPASGPGRSPRGRGEGVGGGGAGGRGGGGAGGGGSVGVLRRAGWAPLDCG